MTNDGALCELLTVRRSGEGRINSQWSLLELEHVALGVDAIAAFDTVELPFLLSAIQVPTEDFCRLSCVFILLTFRKSLIGVFSRFRGGLSIVMFAAMRCGI